MPTHEHMEHAEHAEHAAHDPFDRRVALTIAIVAAVLASVTVLAHRAHTETLLLQGEATSLSNESYNKWSLYGFQKSRLLQAEFEQRQLVYTVPAPGTEKKVEKYKSEVAGLITKYTKQLPEWKLEAEEFTNKSRDKLHETHAMHERAARYDLGELFVEVALVLCSIAILTKRKSFWFVGMAVCAFGAAVAISGLMGLFFMEPMHAAHHDEKHEQKHDTKHDDSHPKDGDHKKSEKKSDNAHH
jgi:hypothetical protein